MIVAIHQPNYFPWLGYFQKILLADMFLFPDDVQFSKNSYTNRVQIRGREKSKWMTIPVSYNFGDPINTVFAANRGWMRSHLDQLRNAYGQADAFSETWAWVQGVFEGLTETNDLASMNREIVEAVARQLNLDCNFGAASDHKIDESGDDRLVALMQATDPGGTYLSGTGGANYQDDSKFEAAGFALRYADFHHPRYAQAQTEFTPGLSTLDALFHLGREKTAELLHKERPSA